MAIDQSSRVSISNPSAKPLVVIFEPWAHEYILPPTATYTFEGVSPIPGWLDVEQGQEAVIVTAWDLCVGRVYDANGHLIHSLDVRVPDFREWQGHGGEGPNAAV